MISKDGYKIIAYTAAILVLFILLAFFLNSSIFETLSYITGVLLLFHFYFFRDPDRKTPEGDKLVISPADGQVIKIDEVEEPLYFKEKVRRVCIFMNIFSVHVNRLPVSGKVEVINYSRGEYLSAFKDDAAVKNEQNAIGVSTKYGQLLFIQIAGLIARRIVSHLNIGDEVKTGERFGMIKYSSRVDVYLPLSAKINVELKQWVKAGTTVIGEFE
jgi:phosphatidylserine decarboxylase